MKSKFDIHNAVKEWNSLLSSEDDDDLKEELPEKAEKQIVSDKERDKVDVPICEDDLYDVSIPQHIFPYEDYRIIGDTAQIDNVLKSNGVLNIDYGDIRRTLSTDKLNYISVGIGDNITDVLEQSVENLPISTENISDMLIYVFSPKFRKLENEAMNWSDAEQIVSFTHNLPVEIKYFWGLGYDGLLTDKIEVILIASSK